MAISATVCGVLPDRRAGTSSESQRRAKRMAVTIKNHATTFTARWLLNEEFNGFIINRYNTANQSKKR